MIIYYNIFEYDRYEGMIIYYLTPSKKILCLLINQWRKNKPISSTHGGFRMAFKLIRKYYLSKLIIFV